MFKGMGRTLPLLLNCQLILTVSCNVIPHGTTEFHQSSNARLLLGSLFDTRSRQIYSVLHGITVITAPSMQVVPLVVSTSMLNGIHRLTIGSNDHPWTPREHLL